MNSTSYLFYSISLMLIGLTLLTKARSVDNERRVTTLSSVQKSSTTKFIPYHYDRYIFIFLAQKNNSITKMDFKSISYQLDYWDDTCGAESMRVTLYLPTQNSSLSYEHKSVNLVLRTWCSNAACFNDSIVPGAVSSSVNPGDTGGIAETLIKQTDQLWQNNYDVFVTTQVILITDYVTDSLKDNTTINKLLELKEKRNVTFISLNKALSDGNNVNDYFSRELWNSYTDYLHWNSSLYSFYENDTINPICGRKTDHYTTPDPAYDNPCTLNIYPFLSREYIDTMGMAEVVELLARLAARRWQHPCRQCHIVSFQFFIPIEGTVSPFAPLISCYAEDTTLDDLNLYCTPQIEQWGWFSDFIQRLENTNYPRDITCKYYDILFNYFLEDSKGPFFRQTWYLLITDLPMKCPNITRNISAILDNYNNHTTGAPFTVIAIDKTSRKDVYNSFVDLFPPVQAPNLYSVKSISDLLPNITKSIYFCLDTAPSLELITTPTPFAISAFPVLASHPSFWYFYLIAALVITSLIGSVIVFIKIRNKKRKEALQQLQLCREISTTTTQANRDIYNDISLPVDVWEVPLKLIDIHYNETIGKGAFSIVYSGFLRGRAPVLDVYSSIALQNFVDCNVAVKTLPQHHKESDKAVFLSEIQLMKDIGYHVHLVSMLGCNCSVERPFLVMELAEQSLLQWLIHTNAAMDDDTEINLEKTLLSFSWQISNGMNYLSSKHFIHRDLAARNILLNKRSKAMVSDFGLCHKLDHVEQVLTISGGKLPVKWLAVESLLEHKFSIKTDVWSFGVLLYEIYCLGQEPYRNVPVEDFVKHLQEGQRPEQPRCSNEELYELMKGCWHADPTLRPDFATIQNVLRGMLEDSTENYGYLHVTEADYW